MTGYIFPNNGAGLIWGSNKSQIYDDSNLQISTDDYMYLYAPMIIKCVITSPSTSLTGRFACTSINCGTININNTLN